MRKDGRKDMYDDTFIPEFGTRLKNAIDNKGYTLKQFSLKLGFDAGTVCSYTNDRIFPSVPTLKKMCELLDVSADYLLELED